MPKSVAYVGTDGSGGPGDWITPPGIIELAHDVLNNIDLDPMSSQTAQQYVNASRFWTPEYDAFQQRSWQCRTLWLNPPYSRGVFSTVVDRFIEEWMRRRIGKALVLTNNVTETESGQKLLGHCDCVWFPAGRLAFINSEGKPVANNTRGQMLTAFGIDWVAMSAAIVRHGLGGTVR